MILIVQLTCLYELAYIKEAFMCGFWETSVDLCGVALRTLKVWIALWKVADEHYRDLNACIFCWCWYLASWVVQKNIKGKKSLHLLHKSKWHIPHKTKSNAEKINSNISRLFLNRYKAQFQCHMLGSVASLTKTNIIFHTFRIECVL